MGGAGFSFEQSSSVERIIAHREHHDVVAGRESLVRGAVSGDNARDTRKGGQLHQFILEAVPEPAQIALVGVLPEADRELLRLLNVESTGRARNRRIEAAELPAPQVLVETSVVDEVRVAPAALRSANRPRVGVGLVLAIVGIDVVAVEWMGNGADHE